MRVVLDTDIVVAGARSDRGASFQWLLAELERRITLLLSVALCLEYEAVLTRSEHLRPKAASAAEMRRIVDAPVAVAEPAGIGFLGSYDHCMFRLSALSGRPIARSLLGRITR